MSSARTKLTLDERAFEGLLAAAFTIQEHNDKQRRARETEHRKAVPTLPNSSQPEDLFRKHDSSQQDQTLPAELVSPEEFRPGEKMQRKWASLWQISQERGLGVEDFGEGREPEPREANEGALARYSADAQEESTSSGRGESEWAPTVLTDVELTAPVTELNEVEGSRADEVGNEKGGFSLSRLWEARLTLRYHRADLYLVLAIVIATIAMLWVLLATPVTGARQKPRLRPWERALVSLGLAEEPAPAKPVYRGNPSAQVWVDPHSALYYCAGEDQYGKTPNGHYSSQRDAQMDQFEPAEREACE